MRAIWQGERVELQQALAQGPGWPSLPAYDGPLGGVKVLDLSRVLAGPYCCMVLADLGADVLKVERPGSGDDTRHWGPPFHGDDAAYFLSVNRDRRSVALDLTTTAGRTVVARLAEQADVVVENFLPRHFAALGLEALRDKGSAVWVSVRGAGGDGPDGDKPGYDVMAQARSGLMSITGTTEPTKVGVAVADVVTGLYAAVGAVAGLVARRPVRIEVGLLESAVAMLVNQGANSLIGGLVPRPSGNAHPNIVPYGPSALRRRGPRRGGRQRRSVRCAVPGRGPGAAARVDDERRSRQRPGGGRRGPGIAAARRSAREWSDVLAEHGIPCAPVQDLSQLAGDPQLVATGQLQTVDHPAGPVTVVGSPYRIDGVRPRVHHAPPLLGQHTREVLTALGLSDSQIEEVVGVSGS